MPQAAESFPTHLLPLVAAVLALIALAVAAAAPAAPRRLDELWQRARRLGSRAGMGIAGAVAAGLVLASFLPLGPPVPRVTDEFAYLLSADTLLAGRMANPPAPSVPHFRADNVLDEPTRSGRYPPAQGLALALGWQISGAPWGGLVLTAALLAAGTVWMLRPWVGAPWPLVGGLLAALGPAFGSYWSQSFWGGHVAALGGLLVMGAAGRLRRRRVSAATAVALGTGLGILAASRPWEGLAVGLVVAPWVGWRLLAGEAGARLRAASRVLVPALLAFAPWLVLIAAHNRAVTGDVLTLPHVLYRETAGGLPELRFRQAPSRSAEAEGPWFDSWAAAGRGARMVYHLLGLPLAAVALAGASRSLGSCGRGPSGLMLGWSARSALPLAVVLAVAASHGLTRPYFPHYSAPAFAALWLLGIAGARRSGAGGRAGGVLAVTLAGAQLLFSLAELPAHRPDALDWSRERLRIEGQLAATGARHLVFVPGSGDWVANGAELAAAPVLWVHALGPGRDCELVSLLPGRSAWRARGADGVGPFVLEPYPECGEGSPRQGLD